jgi:hypothetical protein
MNAAGDNTLLSTLTGNAIRGMLWITRNASGVRVDGFSDPIYLQLDNRSLGRLNPDVLRQWSEEFYTSWGLYGVANAANGAAGAFVSSNASDGLAADTLYSGAGADDLGVYNYPRFMNPGDLTGSGWLYTANSTKFYLESSSANAVSTAELITDEVYPVGAVDATLVDI